MPCARAQATAAGCGPGHPRRWRARRSRYAARDRPWRRRPRHRARRCRQNQDRRCRRGTGWDQHRRFSPGALDTRWHAQWRLDRRPRPCWWPVAAGPGPPARARRAATIAWRSIATLLATTAVRAAPQGREVAPAPPSPTPAQALTAAAKPAPEPAPAPARVAAEATVVAEGARDR